MALVGSWTHQANATGGFASTAFPITVTIPVGRLLILALANNGATLGTPTITDSRANTWVTGTGLQQGSTGSIRLARCKVTTALQSGDVINLGLDGTRNRWAVALAAFDDVATTSTLATNTSSATNSPNVIGPSLTVPSGTNLVIGAVMNTEAGYPVTATTGTLGPTILTTGASANRAATIIYRYVDGPGSHNVAGTIPSSAYACASEALDSTDVVVPTGPTVTVWNGTAEVPATIKLWNGSTEVPVTVGVS